jgi:hypothetical protein
LLFKNSQFSLFMVVICPLKLNTEEVNAESLHLGKMQGDITLILWSCFQSLNSTSHDMCLCFKMS